MPHTTSDERRRIGKKQRKRIPIIRSPVGPSKRKPTRQERFPSRAHPEVGIGRGRQLESTDPLRGFTSEEKDIINKKFKKYQEELLRRRQSPPTIRPNPKTMEIKKGGKVMKKKGGKVLYKAEGSKVINKKKKKKTGSLPVTAVDRKTGKKDPVATKRIKKSNELLERTYPSEMTGMRGGLRSPIQRRVNDLIRQFVSDEDARTMRTTRKVADHPRMQEKGLIGSRSKPLDAPRKHGGGMSHVGLSPAEEARAGTMSETERARYMRGGGPIHTTFSKRAAPHTEGREPEVDLFPKVKRKKSGKVYRSLGGKVTNGNDVTKIIYD